MKLMLTETTKKAYKLMMKILIKKVLNMQKTCIKTKVNDPKNSSELDFTLALFFSKYYFEGKKYIYVIILTNFCFLDLPSLFHLVECCDLLGLFHR